jgi:hypothetical protein
MPKLKLLILDANVVIFLFENGLWQQVLARCEIHLSRIVAEDEVRYYHGREADKLIDLSDDVTQGRVHLFDLAPSDLKQFVDQFDPLYLDRLDPGESESLAFLVLAKEEYFISSGDAIVYKRVQGAGKPQPWAPGDFGRGSPSTDRAVTKQDAQAVLQAVQGIVHEGG